MALPLPRAEAEGQADRFTHNGMRWRFSRCRGVTPLWLTLSGPPCPLCGWWPNAGALVWLLGAPESPPLHGSLPRETGLLPGSSTSPLGFQKLLGRQHAPAGPWLGLCGQGSRAVAQAQPSSVVVLGSRETQGSLLTKGHVPSFSVPLSLSSSPSPRTFLQLFPPSPSSSPAPNHKGARQVSFCSDKEDILPGNKTPGSPLAGTPTFRAPSTSSLPLSSPILESERENSPTTNHNLLISQGLKRGREDSCLSLVPPHRLGKCWKDTYTAPPSESPVGTYLGSTVYSSGSDSDHSSEFPSDAWGSPD